MCSYLKCGKSGDTQANCWMRQKDQEIAQLKRLGKSRSSGKSVKSPKYKAGSRKKGPCFVCGSTDHRAYACPDRSDKSKSENPKRNVPAERAHPKEKRAKTDWNKYVRKGGDELLEDDDSIRMLSNAKELENAFHEVSMAEDDECVFLDSCAFKRLFVVRDQSFLESFNYTSEVIQTTRADTQLTYIGLDSIKNGQILRCVPTQLRIFVLVVCYMIWDTGYFL